MPCILRITQYLKEYSVYKGTPYPVYKGKPYFYQNTNILLIQWNIYYQSRKPWILRKKHPVFTKTKYLSLNTEHGVYLVPSMYITVPCRLQKYQNIWSSSINFMIWYKPRGGGEWELPPRKILYTSWYI